MYTQPVFPSAAVQNKVNIWLFVSCELSESFVWASGIHMCTSRDLQSPWMIYQQIVWIVSQRSLLWHWLVAMTTVWRSSFCCRSGPKLYKEPSAKSNKHIIQNALAHCCLAGKVNEGQKNKILEVQHDAFYTPVCLHILSGSWGVPEVIVNYQITAKYVRSFISESCT